MGVDVTFISEAQRLKINSTAEYNSLRTPVLSYAVLMRKRTAYKNNYTTAIHSNSNTFFHNIYWRSEAR